MPPKLADLIASTHDVPKDASWVWNECRGVVLKNGLKVLVVSDPAAKESSIALTVQVGSMSDPRSVQGLARLCQLTLVQDTNYYGFTEKDHTSFSCRVEHEHFKEGLDTIMQVIHKPQFNQNCIDRAIDLLQFTYSSISTENSYRLERILQVTGNPDHDFSKFDRGNRETLYTIPHRNGIDIRQALIDFHSKWYSSNIMSMYVRGKDSLDDLTDVVADVFGSLPNRSVVAPEWSEHPFTQKELPVQVKVVPVDETREMIVSFPLPDFPHSPLSDQGRYLRSLLIDPSKGGLLWNLKRKRWVTNIFILGCSSSLFQMHVKLSSEGLEHTDDVVSAIFQYLRLVRQHRPQESRFEQMKERDDWPFELEDEPGSFYPFSLVRRVQLYEWTDLLSEHHLLDQYRPESISEMLSFLISENAHIVLVSNTFKGSTNQLEKYFSIEYSVERIPDSKISLWKTVEVNPEFCLPTPTKVVATDMLVVPDDARYTNVPIALVDEPHTRIWFLQDNSVPRISASLELRSPKIYEDPLSYCLTCVAIRSFEDSNDDYFNTIALAGYRYKLTPTSNGIRLHLEGNNDMHKQAILERVCGELVNFKIDLKRFDFVKEQYIDELKKLAMKDPCYQVDNYIDTILTEKHWTCEQLLLAVADKGCTGEQCELFLQAVLQQLYVEALVLGNMTADDARSLGEAIRNTLKGKPWTFNETPNLRCYKLHRGERYQLDCKNYLHLTNAVKVYFQVGSNFSGDIRTEALTDLFCAILRRCVHALETELGTNVYVWMNDTNGSYGMNVRVVSDKDLSLAPDRIDLLINDIMKEHLKEMKLEQFENIRKATIAHILKKRDFFEIEFAELFEEIKQRTYMFNRPQLRADEMAKLSKDDMISFLGRYLERDAPERRQLVVKVESQSTHGEMGLGAGSEEVMIAVAEFRKEHDFIEDAIAL